MEILINNILRGASAGFIAACSGWWKTNKEVEIEHIDWKNGIRTVAIGVCTGIVAAVIGVNIDDLDGTIYLAGVTMLVDNTIKIVGRKILPRIALCCVSKS